MRLSWNEIRARAALFADDWQHARYEKGESQSFYNAFFRVFGVERRQVARFEENVKKLNNRPGFIDLFWPKVLIVEQKSAGRDLARAAEQAAEYFDALPDDQKPRYQLVCDFRNFELLDRDTRETLSFALPDLPRHVEKFRFILGRQTHGFKDQDPVNIKASELVGHLHDALFAANYRGHDLEVFLTRIVFCLFADNTGIFETRDLFLNFLLERTREDGADMGGWMAQLFQVLDTPEDRRQSTLDDDLARFPYVNGSLFEGAIRIPAFDSTMRKRLIDACRFDWSPISPAIFGSLFQSVMNAVERRAAGAHYTTEANIMKVIGPLFMDDLRAEFARLRALRRDKRRRLEAFQGKLGRLTFFDPACGCGNFLIIAYRELRALELDIMRELKAMGQLALLQSKIDVDQFFGIEIGEFPVRIAETALWMMDHIMNMRLSEEFGQVFLRIPLQRSPTIVHGDALEIDWEAVLAAKKCSFVLGNPPFVGAKYQTVEQREQVRRIAGLGKSGGTLDYVCSWFIKAGEYARGKTRIGFVATNSITQGEQVAQLWPRLFGRCGLEIAFAHRTFAWGSEARGKAAVHVIIIGLDRAANKRPEVRLFSYPDIKGDPVETRHKVLSPYLFDAGGLGNPQLVVRSESRPVNGMPRLITGSKPIDEGNYILSEKEHETLTTSRAAEAEWYRPFIGAREFIRGETRWIVHPASIPIEHLKALKGVRSRMARVREYRLKSKSKPTLAIADTPSEFHVTVIPNRPFLVIPQVSSERRQYAPIGYLEPPVIPSDKLRLMLDAELFHFALLTSAMHMAWMRTVTGRMKSDYMYSVGVVYNTFPLPPGGIARVGESPALRKLAQAILDARAAHPQASLADLYDPDLMPPDLRRAHQANDRAVDRLYRRSGFADEAERIGHLFALYEAMAAPLLGGKPKRRRRRD